MIDVPVCKIVNDQICNDCNEINYKKDGRICPFKKERDALK